MNQLQIYQLAYLLMVGSVTYFYCSVKSAQTNNRWLWPELTGFGIFLIGIAAFPLELELLGRSQLSALVNLILLGIILGFNWTLVRFAWTVRCHLRDLRGVRFYCEGKLLK